MHASQIVSLERERKGSSFDFVTNKCNHLVAAFQTSTLCFFGRFYVELNHSGLLVTHVFFNFMYVQDQFDQVITSDSSSIVYAAARAEFRQGATPQNGGVSLAGTSSGQMCFGQATLSVSLNPYFSQVSKKQQVRHHCILQNKCMLRILVAR
jgi:hypothetical protein